jgi:hypothetical protein
MGAVGAVGAVAAVVGTVGVAAPSRAAPVSSDALSISVTRTMTARTTAKVITANSSNRR